MKNVRKEEKVVQVNNQAFIPNGPALVVMVGASGAGKSTFIDKYFHSHEVVSTDAIRQELTGDFRRQDANDAVFAEFYRRIEMRLKLGRLVVADATHIRDADRKQTAMIAKNLGFPVIYIIIERPLDQKLTTGGWRLGVPGLIEKHDQVYQANRARILSGDGIADQVVLNDTPTFFNGSPDYTMDYGRKEPVIRRSVYTATFDKIRIIGDVHGNYEAMVDIVRKADDKTFFMFLGDVVDYGPDCAIAMTYVNGMVASGNAFCVKGNHERKIFNYYTALNKNGVFKGNLSAANQATVDQANALKNKNSWINNYMAFYHKMPDVIAYGNHVFAHGAVAPSLWNKIVSNDTVSWDQFWLAGAEYEMAMFGEVDKDAEKDKYGYPKRIYNWVDEIPEGYHVWVGHAILGLEPVDMIGKKGGKVTFMDTGSSKIVNTDEIRGVPGVLSYRDIRA